MAKTNISKNAAVKFSGIWKNPKERDLSKQGGYTIRPAPRKMKGGLASNDALLKGVYTGANQEFSLSSYLVGGMIDVPKNLLGVPGVIPDEGQDDRLIAELNPLIVDEYPVLVTTMLIQGTAWRWARWSDKLRRLVWETIPDASVTQIIIDLDTGEIAELWIEEQIEYNKGEINTAYTTRKRHITRTLITEEWKGAVNKTVQYKNPFGFMPIPFGHNCYEGEWRGNSVFGRVLRWLKAIHDIAYKRDEILSEFNPKLTQAVKDPKTWIENNTPPGQRGKDIELDPFESKLFINQEGESTNFLFLPSDATAQHTAAIKDNEMKVIKGSGIPELFFGALATGNYASTETDRLLALEHVKGIRRELTKGTQELVNQSLKILSFMRFTQPPQVSIQWGNVSLLSEAQKAQVMGSYAQAIVALMGNGAISPEGAFYLTKELYPEFPADDVEHFMAGLDEMITQHSSKLGQPAFDMGGMGGF
jgi:hypothetical protein